MRISILRSIIAGVCISATAITTALAQQKWVRYRAPEFAERPGWSVGTNFGLCDLWGDVGTKSPIFHYVNEKYWDRPHFMGGLYARYALHPGFVPRIGINYGTAYASDNFNYNLAKNATTQEEDAYQRYARNLDAKANIWEGYVLFEINIFRLGNLESKRAKKRMQPYLLLGGGYFHYRTFGTYTPRGTDGRINGQSRQVDLHDLELEGENANITDSAALSLNFAKPTKTWNPWQPSMNLGLGLRWDLGKKLTMGIEYMYRYTFTDYLDGVSNFYVDPRLFDYIHANDPNKAAMAKDMYDKSWQIDRNYKHGPGEIRGTPGVNDGYSTISLTFFYRIKSKQTPWWYQENW